MKMGKTSLIVFLAFFLVFTISVNAEDIFDCQTLDEEHTIYRLQNDILNSNESICMDIQANNIILDCQNHLIEGSGSGIAIFINENIHPQINRIMIKNCVITGWGDGIYMNNVRNVLVKNSDISFNSQNGIKVLYAENVFIKHNEINNNTSGGLYLSSSSNNHIIGNGIGNSNRGIYLSSSNFNTIDNNKLNNHIRGIYIRIGSNNIIRNNKIINNNPYGIYMIDDDGEDNQIYNNFFNNMINVGLDLDEDYTNYWNTTLQTGPNIIHGPYLGGNYWSKPDGTGFSQICPDLDDNGICDTAYVIDASCEVNIDYLPLTLIETPFNAIITNPIEGSTITSSSTQLEVTTNEDAICEYALARFIQYNGSSGQIEPYIPQNMSVTGGTFHQQLITGLENTINNATQSEGYSINIECIDYSGNSNEDSVEFYVELIHDEK